MRTSRARQAVVVRVPLALRLGALCGDEAKGGLMTHEASRGPERQAIVLAVGLADLAVSSVGSAVGKVRGLLRRADGAELAADAERELAARGRLVLDRYATAPPAHLEVLAQQVSARRAAPRGDV